jgi:glycosyltransferase involved in cell wall biosynthesis
MPYVETKPILQYGSLAAWPYWLAEALTSIGHPSLNVIPEETDVHDLDRRLPFHEAICSKSTPRLWKIASRAAFLAKVPSRFSLVHYHGSHLLRDTQHHLVEGRYLAARGVPMLVTFGGGDARIVELARARNPYFYRKADPARDDGIRRYLRSISRYIRYAATDCEMAEYVAPYFSEVFTYRQPVDVTRFTATPLDIDRPPIFLHVPTEPEVKGTSHVLEAVQRLKAEGLDFEFRMLRRLTQAEFYREMASCDVYVDELRCGSHGVTAVEAMASGKPTVTYIRPDLVGKYPPDMPLISANPDTIYDVMRRLVHEPQMRREVGIASRRYAEKYHAAPVVAEDMLAVYRHIGHPAS